MRVSKQVSIMYYKLFSRPIEKEVIQSMMEVFMAKSPCYYNPLQQQRLQIQSCVRRKQACCLCHRSSVGQFEKLNSSTTKEINGSLRLPSYLNK